MKIAIVNLNLEYKYPDNMTDEEIREDLIDVELPDNYVSDSFDLVKIEKE